jgi:chaperonin GroES
MSKKDYTIQELIDICQSDLDPREDRVIIYQDDAEKVTKGGIIKPEISIQKPSQGTIMVVGPGDRCIYGRFAGVDITWKDVVFIVVRQSDIMLREKKK